MSVLANRLLGLLLKALLDNISSSAILHTVIIPLLSGEFCGRCMISIDFCNELWGSLPLKASETKKLLNLQTAEIQMGWLMMSHLILVYTVCPLAEL